MSISKVSRTVAFRLTLFFSLFFALCVIMLLGFVYWRTAAEMIWRVDQVLVLEKTRFAQMQDERVQEEIAKSIQRDQRHVYFYALFSPDGHPLAGNVAGLPGGVPPDGRIYEDKQPAVGVHEPQRPVRVLVVRRDSGNLLLIGHDVQQLIEFGEIMKSAFIWGGTLTIALGLGFGLVLSSRPLRRVEQIQQVCEFIMRGDFSRRLPVSRRRDELDMLAAIVNRMLDEIERLMSEVKSAGDNIAHDLRTPLTRLRAMLYRVQQQLADAPAQRPMVAQAIVEVDSLLLRFRALLRISEIENKQRRAGFKLIGLQGILEQAVGLFEPLAEDNSIRLSLVTDKVDDIHCDGELMFEAIVNLLDNSIKFTPAGGSVEVRLSKAGDGPRIDIIDSGYGIRASEREIVLNRFRRGGGDLQAPGHGLGLSIVTAIVRLHDFSFELDDASPGTRATIFCRPHGL